MQSGQKHSEVSRLMMSMSRKGKPAHNKGQRKDTCFRGHIKTNPESSSCAGCQRITHKEYDARPDVIISRKNSAWKARGMLSAEGYSFTMTDYDRLYQTQQGRCKICKTHQSELKQVFDVDHSHITGVVRGLLCHGCNIKVGSFESPLAAEIRKYLGDK